MADTAQERTEAPTPRRRAEARRQGQVGRSTDLTAAAVLLASLIVLHTMGERILGRLMEVMRHCLSDHGTAVDPRDAIPVLAYAFRECAAVVLPLMLVVFVVALAVSLGQVGFLLTLKTITPSLDKLNPVSGLQRMFSARSVVHLVLGILKMSLLALLAWWTLSARVEHVLGTIGLDHLAFVAAAAELMFTLGIRLAIALLVLGIIDFTYQKWKTTRDIRMTKEEIKEELKRMEGDPMIRRRRREIQMQMAMRRIRAAVPKADVVITNPTELAIVIQYDAATMNAPRVTAKGADHLARTIRELAILHGVPIVERKPLAQALYRTVEVGREIPAEFYKAVAEILAYVYELSGRRSRRLAAAMN